jgi:hypothetical protein
VTRIRLICWQENDLILSGATDSVPEPATPRGQGRWQSWFSKKGSSGGPWSLSSTRSASSSALTVTRTRPDVIRKCLGEQATYVWSGLTTGRDGSRARAFVSPVSRSVVRPLRGSDRLLSVLIKPEAL